MLDIVVRLHRSNHVVDVAVESWLYMTVHSKVGCDAIKSAAVVAVDLSNIHHRHNSIVVIVSVHKQMLDRLAVVQQIPFPGIVMVVHVVCDRLVRDF